MIEPDTIKLLRECDAGVKMGVSSIKDVLDQVKDPELRQRLDRCQEEHQALDRELQKLLADCHDEGKDPNPMAKGMSWMETQVKLAINQSDATIAGLMTDGCNMGVKSLHKYLNQYKAASEEARDITMRLIALEEGLTADLRKYL